MTSKLSQYLNKKQKKGDDITHTRIGNKKDIHGGSYQIKTSDLEEFYNLYYHNIFIEKKCEYLTEKQVKNGPILVDFDFRYDQTITERPHNKGLVEDMIDLYLQKIKKILCVTDESSFPIFIFEKPNINILKKEPVVKDGIHMIIGLSMSNELQLELRKEVLEEIHTVWEKLPITNNWENVLDRGISVGYTNWQLIGSRKPDNEAYELTMHYVACLDTTDGEFEMEEKSVDDFNYKKNLFMLSARNDTHFRFEPQDNVKKKLSSMNSKKGKKKIKIKSQKKLNIEISDISNKDELYSMVDNMIETVKDERNYYIKEAHDYTMILPDSYYESGSYDKWLRVGIALYHTDERLFLTWILFSSQSKTFDYSDIPGFYDLWTKFGKNKKDNLTYRSIIYWARTDAPKDRCHEVYKETLDFYIDITVSGDFTMSGENKKTNLMMSGENKKTKGFAILEQCGRDYDIAVVLYQMFKGKYICSSISGKGKWWKFHNHKWEENEDAFSLRLAISEDMYQLYQEKVVSNMERVQTFEEDDPRWNGIRNRTHNLAQICQMLKKCASKENILKEAKGLFYDSTFIDMQDQNPYLLCFNNGVFDFKENVFRDGKPEDYITKSTHIDYYPLESFESSIISQIDEFMYQLFPVEELRTYMWEHLASTLIGTNENQTFNIYKGAGRNGKSMLVSLMSKMLGDYKGTVPITLITQKRGSIGGVSPEVTQLKSLRYAVMQEPTKGDKINEGIMKEITGGDPIQGRGLYESKPLLFVPQFKLIVCTNTDLEIKSNDDGTWRRIRLCEFMSRFKERPIKDDPDEPYQFKVDKKLEEKFDDWKGPFMSKLVAISKEKKGNVTDCDIVMKKSNEYREGQDYLTEFVNENIEVCEDECIKKDELYQHFSAWYKEHYGRNIPPGKEIYDFINKKYGKCKRKMWEGIKIIYTYEDDQED